MVLLYRAVVVLLLPLLTRNKLLLLGLTTVAVLPPLPLTTLLTPLTLSRGVNMGVSDTRCVVLLVPGYDALLPALMLRGLTNVLDGPLPLLPLPLLTLIAILRACLLTLCASKETILS